MNTTPSPIPPPLPPPVSLPSSAPASGTTMLDKGRSVLSGATFKLFVIGVLTLLMLIPIGKIWFLLSERQHRRDAAVANITEAWGRGQEIIGPVLVVPYRYAVKVQRTEMVNGKPTQVETVEHPLAQAYFLPAKLKLDARLAPQERHRGIYKAVVYGGKLAVSGEFQPPLFDDLGVEPERILWEDAVFCLAVTDLRGVEGALSLDWAGRTLPLLPGCRLPGFETGVMASLRDVLPAAAKSAAIPFQFNLTFNGSKLISFAPAGVETEVRLAADWPDPSFEGAFLPGQREVNASGFSAQWNVSYYGRGYPQKWTSLGGGPSPDKIRASMFGASLLTLVDQYRTVERALKYAILFIVLAFAGFFLFETLGRVRIHPVQYTLVGAALCLFYLILLALSEFVGFGAAYLAGAAASSLLIGIYAAGVLRGGGRGCLTAAALGGVYGFLYVVLQLEDYSLLIGTAGLFVLLAAIMLATRKTNWYEHDLAAGRSPGVPPDRP
ncbi:MAG: cell envelope integrity protein CreD [Lentisphaeria bacterium]